MDSYPVPDKSGPSRPKRQATSNTLYNVDQVEQQAIRDRQQISRWDRDSLEDKYLKLQEDNLLLKRHSRKQEEKLKRFAVKLVKLNTDKRKAEAAAAASGVTKKPLRDVTSYEDQIEKLTIQLHNAETEKAALSRNVHLLQSQLDISGHKPLVTTDVQSRIDTGIKKDGVKRNLRVVGPPTARGVTKPSPGKFPQYGHGLLEEARQANSQLKRGTRFVYLPQCAQVQS
ncbi:protein fantom-like [Watersipora subatra]|uniref:protein fantom-like n=1 Tax=Watersipora subatra TaxID=2589382 RepID=UPI00355C06D4